MCIRDSHIRACSCPDSFVHRPWKSVILIQGDDLYLGKAFFHKLSAPVLRTIINHQDLCSGRVLQQSLQTDVYKRQIPSS